MNRSQIILSAIGGVAALGALALGYFIWDAACAKAEKAEALDGGLSTAAGILKKLPLKPERPELAIYERNGAAYGDWRTDAEKVAAQGDLVFEKTTPAAFKTAIVDEARKIADLPGCFDGKLVKSDFTFGFKDYIAGGALPPDDPAQLKRLQREWNDVASVLRTIAACGGASAGVLDVRMGKAAAKAAALAESADETPGFSKKGKKNKKAKKARVEAERKAAAEDGGPAVASFTVDFMARPSGLVKTVNAFATGTRFVVVESCTFERERDALAEALGGDAKREAEQATSGRRRRRAQQEEKKDEAKSALVSDPATAPLLKVSMALSVYDFKSLEESEAEAKAEGKGESK